MEKGKQMLKAHLKKRGISVYALAKETGVPYSTLNDLVNGKVRAENCKAGLLFSVSRALNITMDEAYQMCSREEQITRNSYGIETSIAVKNKSYYANFEYDGGPVEIRLCKISEDSSFYIDEIAAWRSEDYIRQRRMEAFGDETDKE